MFCFDKSQTRKKTKRKMTARQSLLVVRMRSAALGERVFDRRVSRPLVQSYTLPGLSQPLS
jgi:hypothetical protein